MENPDSQDGIMENMDSQDGVIEGKDSIEEATEESDELAHSGSVLRLPIFAAADNFEIKDTIETDLSDKNEVETPKHLSGNSSPDIDWLKKSEEICSKISDSEEGSNDIKYTPRTTIVVNDKKSNVSDTVTGTRSISGDEDSKNSYDSINSPENLESMEADDSAQINSEVE